MFRCRLAQAIQICSIAIASFATTSANLDAEFAHSAWLDANENYRLYWTVNRAEKSITFATEVKTTGWIGFGISKGLQGTMKGSDIVIAWIDNTGKAHLTDRHGTGNSKPVKDAKQDYQLISASQNSTTTIFKFKRKLNTCDKDDNSISTVTTKVIFAWNPNKPPGADDSQLRYHGNQRRGSRSLNLLNYAKNSPRPAGANYFDLIQRDIKVPAEPTTYWCTPYRLSDLVKTNSTKHIIEFAPVIQKRLEGLVHHMLLYGCNNNFDPKHLNVTGRCYQRSMPKSIRDCVGSSAIFGWAVGGVSFKFPDNVGYPIGGMNDYKYVLLETHFDNPTKRSDFVDTSGLRLYYTDPRKYEAATLTAGAVVYQNMLIPPKQANWVTTGVCTSACSEKIRGHMAHQGDTINIFSSFPHAHTAGKAIRTILVRNGEAVDEVVRDDNYDFNFQQTYTLDKVIKFKAGDELFTYCTYDTSKRKYATVGGLGTNDEMCLNFLMYYPRVNLTDCKSMEHLTYDYFTKFYAKPKWTPRYNKSLPSTWPRNDWNGTEWNSTMVNQLKQVLNYSGQYAIYEQCLGIGGYEYKLPAIQSRPMVTKALPPRPDECVGKKPVGGDHAVHPSISFIFLIFATLYMLNYFT